MQAERTTKADNDLLQRARSSTNAKSSQRIESLSMNKDMRLPAS